MRSAETKDVLASCQPMIRSQRATESRVWSFTLLELLVVIAVIGILASLLFPAVSAGRRAAQAARTKVLFAQWASAIESFRSEYGHYPAFDSTGLVNGGVTGAPGDEHLFHDILAGCRRDGSPLAAAGSGPISAAMQNRKRVRFHAFSEAEISGADAPAPYLVRDASGGTAIAVLVDRDLDGLIRVGAGGDYAAAPAVAGVAPDVQDLPATGVRAGVIFYSPAPGSTAGDRRFVFSWK